MPVIFYSLYFSDSEVEILVIKGFRTNAISLDEIA